MARRRPLIICRGCSNERADYGRRLCAGCYTWWRRHGKPDNIPPPSQRKNNRRFTIEEARRGSRRSHAIRSSARLARIENYQWLIYEQGYTPAEAAERLGVRIATARQYRAEASHG